MSTSSSNRRGRPSDPAARAERQGQILEAAHLCFLRRGFHATTTAEISAEAGISIAGLYQYFENKEALVLALVEKDLDLGIALIDQLREAEDFLFVVEQILGALATDPVIESMARLRVEIVAEASRSPVVADMLVASDVRMTAALVQVIVSAQGQGQIDPDLDPHEMALAVSCLCDGIYGRLCLPEAARGPFVSAALAMIRRTIAPLSAR
jgi:TetR/AcrR family transcriptional repressor of uid operon